MLRSKIAESFKDATVAAIAAGKLGSLSELNGEVPVELPKNPDHGDKAISIAMRLARDAKLAPRAVAEAIVEKLDRSFYQQVDIAGPGFINLRLSWQALAKAISDLHVEAANYGHLPLKTTPKILVEYVSANPTGDLHIGHGRQAVYGSALVSLLKWAGYNVSSEFYINDAGAQMMKLGESVRATILITEGKILKSEYPEDAYPLASMDEFITPEVIAKLSIQTNGFAEYSVSDFAAIGEKIFLEAQRKLLAEIGVEFDQWFSENENLYGGGGANPDLKPGAETKVCKVCELLTKADATYELDAALWFRAKDFGDERDRVLRKADGYYTYLAGDLAYHYDKLSRGYDRLINVWGADHHGQEPSLVAGLLALAKAAPELHFTRETLEIPLIQMVSLQKGGVEVKMSKRTGDIVTVRELLEEVGVDAMRYFLAESQINNRMVFDLELATKQDKDNPVYYAQYAHARCCSIIRTLTGEQINIGDAVTEPRLEKSVLSKTELADIIAEFKSGKDIFSEVFAPLEAESASSTRQLVLELLRFPEEVEDAAAAHAPYKIANYVRGLAGLFHQFYTHNRVIVDDRKLMQARVSLVVATRIVLANALRLLGISAPERM